MRGLEGAGGALCASCSLLVVASTLNADALDPNAGALVTGDAIVFNIAHGQRVFDGSVGAGGALVGFDGASGAASIRTNNPGYAGQFSVGLRWTVPLLDDTSTGLPLNLAMGQFGAQGASALGYQLIDLENDETVLLSGELLPSEFGSYDFTLIEKYNTPGQLVGVNGGGASGLIGLSVTGGSLAPLFPPRASMAVQCWIAVPSSVDDFSEDLFTAGGGSVLIQAVPEPTSLCLLAGGIATVWLRRRRQVLGVVLLLGLFVGPAAAQVDPNMIPGWRRAPIVVIEVSGLRGTFTPGGGGDGLGIMSIDPTNGGPILTVHYEDGIDWTIPVANAVASVAASLSEDTSGQAPLLPDQAAGRFDGNGVGDPDWQLGYDDVASVGDVTFLEGDLDVFEVREILDTGFLEGSGLLFATGGLFVDMDMWPRNGTHGALSSFEFGVVDALGDPLNVSDFSQGFVGDVFLTLWPDDEYGVPEPITSIWLAAGTALFCLRRRS